MRLLFLQDWNLLHGGAERFALDLREALHGAGDEVCLLTADVSPEARAIADVLAPASEHAAAKSLLQVHNPFAAAAVRRAVARFQPDVALVNMFALYLSPSAVTALGRIPYVLLISDYKCICPLGHRLLPDRSICHHPRGVACLRQGCLSLPHWTRDQLRYWRIDRVVRNAAAVVTCSDALQRSLAEQGIESRRIHLFSRATEPIGPRRPAAQPQFLFLGRLDVEKGVDQLIRAFAACRATVPGCRLRLAGRGAMQGQLEWLAAELGVRDGVDFLGWCDADAVDAELSHAWALVAPSRWPEPFGLVALEAIFRGVPAIVTDAGGFAEVVEHGVTGVTVARDDVDALARALADVATGRRFPERSLAPDAVAHARRQFGPQRFLAEFREILLDCAKG